MGRNKLNMKAGGDSPLLNGLMVALVLLSIVDTALVAGLDTLKCLDVDQDGESTEQNKAGEKNQSTFALWSDIPYTVLLAIIEVVAFIKMDAELPFASEIEMDKYQTELKSPYIQFQTKGLGEKGIDVEKKTKLSAAASLAAGLPKATQAVIDAADVAAKALQKAQDALAVSEEGNITTIALKSIKNTATASIVNDGGLNLSNTASVEISNKTAGKITHDAGEINNTAGVISNKGATTITNEGGINNLTAATEMNLKAGVVSVDSAAAVTVKAAGEVSIDASLITLKSAAEVNLTGTALNFNGVVIKLGE